MNFERTHDAVVIREIVTHPNIWPWVTDDFAPPIEQFQPTEHPAIWYFLVFDQEDLLGMWMFVPHNGINWEVHTYLLPGHGVKRARQAAREMAEWIWEHTSCRRIFTHVPTFNRAALKFAEAAGMVQFGVNEKSFLKGGQLYDQVLLGMSKGE